MTWTCPYCNRKYPDSAPKMGIDDFCTGCAIDPREVERLIEDWRDDKRRPPARHHNIWYTYLECADALAELTDGGGE